MVVFSKIKDNPEGYVVFEIKKENELLDFKESYNNKEEINLDKYELDTNMCYI